jgi:hypothetical protein
MTGRHAAPPDELFDQRERETAGSHRADVELPSSPDEAATPRAERAPAKKPVARAKAAPVKKAAGAQTRSVGSASSVGSKKAGST